MMDYFRSKTSILIWADKRKNTRKIRFFKKYCINQNKLVLLRRL